MANPGLRVKGLGFRVWGFRVWGLGFRVRALSSKNMRASQGLQAALHDISVSGFRMSEAYFSVAKPCNPVLFLSATL